MSVGGMPGRRGLAGASAATELIYLFVSGRCAQSAPFWNVRLPLQTPTSVFPAADISAAFFRIAMRDTEKPKP
jgi:hypothetical protein